MPISRRMAGVAVQAVATVVCLLANTGSVRAQDLEPKAYSANPAGAAFLVVRLARSSGSVLTNPTLPLTDVEAKINAVPLAEGYRRRLIPLRDELRDKRRAGDH